MPFLLHQQTRDRLMLWFIYYLLKGYKAVSGLKVKLGNSSLVCFNLEKERVDHLSGVLRGCEVGLPLDSDWRLRVFAIQWLDKIGTGMDEWKSNFLLRSGWWLLFWSSLAKLLLHYTLYKGIKNVNLNVASFTLVAIIQSLRGARDREYWTHYTWVYLLQENNCGDFLRSLIAYGIWVWKVCTRLITKGGTSDFLVRVTRMFPWKFISQGQMYFHHGVGKNLSMD